ncbi:hypothetical protein [Cetobacterium sp.]|uniref:hypothetical protein n=1 Tax=Cetobacterium sp. TaxID=2071632 RepID=UPI003F3EECF2
MDTKILSTIGASFVASLVSSFLGILKIANDSKIKIESLDSQVEELKREFIRFKSETDQKVLLNQAEFISRKEFEMFLREIANINRNVEKLNDKIDRLNLK